MNERSVVVTVIAMLEERIREHEEFQARVCAAGTSAPKEVLVAYICSREEVSFLRRVLLELITDTVH